MRDRSSRLGRATLVGGFPGAELELVGHLLLLFVVIVVPWLHQLVARPLLGSIGALSGAVGALAALQIDEALLQCLFAVLLTAAGMRLLMAKRRDRYGTHSSRSPTQLIC